MPQITNSYQFALEVCKIIKVDPMYVSNIEIKIPARDAVEIVIHKVMVEEESVQIIKQLETLAYGTNPNNDPKGK